MPKFELGEDVHQNVRALRKALGSVTRDLSQADFARLVAERHPERRVTPGLIDRWEKGVLPDELSIAIMAAMAGVSVEDFLLPPSRRGQLENSHRRRKRG